MYNNSDLHNKLQDRESFEKILESQAGSACHRLLEILIHCSENYHGNGVDNGGGICESLKTIMVI